MVVYYLVIKLGKNLGEILVHNFPNTARNGVYTT